MKDHLVANVEQITPLMAKFPRVVNTFLGAKWLQRLIEKQVGYVDAPLLSYPTLTQQQDSVFKSFDLAELAAMPESERQKHVLLVQDPFTSYYDAQVVMDFGRLVSELGKVPVLLPFKPNGKPQHVAGFLEEFAQTATTTAAFLNEVAALNIPLVGVDTPLVLCYRDEYSHSLGEKRGDFTVHTVHEWLQALPDDLWESKAVREQTQPMALFAHCTEKTALPKTEQIWQSIFSSLGQPVDIVKVGCCGMAGNYGHEAQNKANSLGIYAMSWEQAVARYQPDQVMASGYSCRSQVNRIDGFKPKHPLQHLLQCITRK